MMAYFEKKYQSIPIYKAVLLLGVILVGAVVSNFIRLLALIVFHILPDNPMHDIIGLVSMGIYVLLPFYFLLKFIYKKQPLIEPIQQKDHLVSKSTLWITIGLLALHTFNGIQFLKPPVDDIQAIEHIHLDGFERTVTPDGVLKMLSEEALIYVKPPIRFFEGSHDPQVCWKGSGYQFSEVKIDSIHGKSVFSGILKKGEDQLFTAWWFQNATTQTPHEWNWRLNALKGQGNFYMINVNATNRAMLEKWVNQKILK